MSPLAAATLAAAETNDVGMSTPALGDEPEMTVTEAEPIEGEVLDNHVDEPDGPDEGTPPEAVEQAEAMEGTVIQPADVDNPVGTVELHTPHGFLTLKPGQSQLDTNQHAALLAIGIDLENDPGVLPHLRAFIHMCQLRHLDPYAKEAYLIGRGKDEYRKWTMQTSIDGYRKMSASTGRFKRIKARLWTGADDDPDCWREVEEDGVLVRKRVWYDQWPSSRGNPGSAMVIIEHYDEQGELTTTSATADWKFYAPMTPVYEGSRGSRKKKYDAQGQVVMELGEMWAKGDAHMLAKCAEALAHRLAFPNTVHGFYIPEEMHRLDQQERDRQRDEQRAVAQQRIVDARVASDQRALTARVSNPLADITTTVTRAGEPVPVGESARAAVENLRAATRTPRAGTRAPGGGGAQPGAPLSDQLVWWREEILMLSELHEMSRDDLFKRQVKAAGKPLAEFTADELAAVVMPMRAPAAAKMRAQGRGAEAAAYETARPGARPLADLLGRPNAGVEDVDPTKPHEYVDQEGICRWCEAYDDERIHQV